MPEEDGKTLSHNVACAGIAAQEIAEGRISSGEPVVPAKTMQKYAKKAWKIVHDKMDAQDEKAFCSNGSVVLSGPLPAHAVNLKAAELMLKLTDQFPAEKHQVEHSIPLEKILQRAREMFGDPE